METSLEEGARVLQNRKKRSDKNTHQRFCAVICCQKTKRSEMTMHMIWLPHDYNSVSSGPVNILAEIADHLSPAGVIYRLF